MVAATGMSVTVELVVVGIKPAAKKCRCKSRLSHGYSVRGAGRSTSNIIVPFESGDFNLDGRTTITFTLSCRVYMVKGPKISRQNQIRRLVNFVMTQNKSFVNWITRSQGHYYAKIANIDER